MEDNVLKEKLTKAIEVLQDMKALDAKMIEVGEHCSYADYFILVSATSRTHAQSISDTLSKLTKPTPHPEGYDTGQWILNDLGDIIVHVFLKDARSYYHLDKLWAHAPTIELDLEKSIDFDDQYDKVSTL